ncbi:unnamed protein product [Parascedosporium putredinis]|uniref:Uncharacterized protein n=1 Tax=Parascedosporium putredinis TaxID=1442378 RepID=A0A9P1M673_9PEZI|nr:unnamed protein product [Parascedosporium putredinis]CAI7989189.1 unnamed protein product [Parascedosporium putredinis]
MSGSRKAKYLAPCNSELNAAHHVFQKHFESHFEPLPQAQEEGLTTQNRANAAQSSDSSEDEWSGISGDEQDTVEVVDHASKATPPTQAMGKQSGPRPSKTSTSKPSLPSQSLPEDSRTLLAQDLALHRLITESHLLNPSSKLHTKPFSQGRIRMHATDLRITSLAPTGTKSILAQDKMPMTMRKGIKAAKKGR